MARTLGQINTSVLPQRTSGRVLGTIQSTEQKPFTYEVEEPVESREQKIARYKREAEISKKEADKANSPLGFAKNFGKALVENIAPSEVGLGESLSKIYGTKNLDIYLKANQDLTDTQIKLQKLIMEKDAKGEKANELKRAFNANQRLIAENRKYIEDYSKDLPSVGKVAGQIGGTALDILTAGTYGKAKTALMGTGKLASKATPLVEKAAVSVGVPELSKIATQKASGLFTKAGATNVAKGVGLGYASDVTAGLAGIRGEDREGASAFIPGLGTAISGGIPVISETVQSIKNVRNPEIKNNSIIAKRQKVLQQIEDNNSPVRRTIEKSKQQGIDAKKLLSETDLLADAVDDTGTLRTANARVELNDFIADGPEKVIKDNLVKEGRKLPLKTIEKKLNEAVDKSGLEGGALERAYANVQADIKGLARRADKDGYITLAKIHDAKVDKYSNINYAIPESKKADKAIAKGLKELVETHTKSVDVKSLNKELSQHYAVLGLLERLDGKKIQGGKLGKYFAQTLGGIAGSHFGPLGTIVGAELAGAVKGKTLSSSLSGRTGAKLESSPLMKKAIERGKPNPTIILPQSKSLGSLNNAQSANIINEITPNIIPSSIPPNNVLSNLPEQNLKAFQQIENSKLARMAEEDSIKTLSQAELEDLVRELQIPEKYKSLIVKGINKLK